MRYAALCLFLLAGCNTSPSQVDQMIGSGQPPAYKLGYRHGCDSGYTAAGNPYYRFTKEVRRYSSDSLYRQGWDDGVQVCKGKYDSLGR